MPNASMDWPPRACLYMKVGPHGTESLDEILARKALEFETTDRIFWGYGSNVLHPRTQVHPFCSEWVEKQGSVYVLMERIEGRAGRRIPHTASATHYSKDAADWKPLPEGVRTGPAYALVLDEIIKVDREIDLRDFHVGVGGSKGRNAAHFIKYHVDKTCLVAAGGKTPDHPPPKPVSIGYIARLLDPYAVFLRHR